MIKVKVRYIVFFILLAVCYGGWYIAENFVFKSVPEMVVEYCDNKYSINSKWVKYIPEENTENSRVSLVDDGTGIEFNVVRYYDVDGEVHYYDNYYGYKHEEELLQLLSENIPNGYTFTLSLENSNLPEVKDSNIDVVNFCRNSSTVLSVSFTSDHAFSKEEMSEIVDSLNNIVRISANVVVNGSEEQQFAMDENYNLIIR